MDFGFSVVKSGGKVQGKVEIFRYYYNIFSKIVDYSCYVILNFIYFFLELDI